MSPPRRRGNWDPAPAARWEDAFLVGNGRHGAMVHGDPADEQVVVNHHLLVRPNGAEHCRAPQLADGLERLRDDILAGRAAEAVHRTLGDLPLQWVRPFHPAFAVRVGRPRTPVTDYRRAIDYRTGTVRTTWTQDGGRWASECFVSRADDVIVHRLTPPPYGTITAQIHHDVRLPGAPADLRVSSAAAEEHPDEALISTSVRYPRSDLGYSGWTRIIARAGTLRTSGGTTSAEGCTELTLLTRVAPWSAPGAPAQRQSYEALSARDRPLHQEPYDRVELDLDAPPEHRALPASSLLADPGTHRLALLERLFDAGRHHLLSSSGLLPPRLTGIWTGDWETAWQGAFTCDANLNLQMSSAAVAALPEVSLSLAALIRSQLDDWRDNATRLFGTRGIVAPAHSDGLSGHAYHCSDAYPLHLWTAGADWLLHPLLDHAAVTGDRSFAREVLAPLLAETAAFYEDFLTRTGPDGTLVLVPSYSPENTPAGADSPVTANATMDIAAARHALRATGESAHAALADRLPPYRINTDGALAEWSWPGDAQRAPDAYDHRHISHLYPVWPLDEINPCDTPELARAARRALELRGAENDSAHGHLHTALVAARLGDARHVAAGLLSVLDQDFFHNGLMSSHYPDRAVYNADAAHTLPAVLIEALLHSTSDRIVLLPALPPFLPTGTLRGIRTRCGVTVTELSWSVPARRLRVVLRAATDLTVGVQTGTAGRPRPHRLPAGRDLVLDLPLGGVPPTNPPPSKGVPPCAEPRARSSGRRS
ncbi:glycoside hydrolase N-terminal domain-containing protein [Streptomyces sp. SPB162]|uniref:glycosyl hydrolase family 95 catalytic domain-containing protein n=1 Tax=Streptomyces sp. SPB162 TaxID=2940560 RepID=UPI0024069728|nr:glycoside hydrolase N-terminal domain-containing protein [Streptomyces sp. SPB162]MDF9810957.1 alpha-L-fucosidase 2 [Streptomyces sp. SPB162]